MHGYGARRHGWMIHNGAHMFELHSALLDLQDAGEKEALVERLAAAAGLPLPATSKSVVTQHLVVAAEMAQLLLSAAPAVGAAEMASVFRLPAPIVEGGNS